VLVLVLVLVMLVLAHYLGDRSMLWRAAGRGDPGRAAPAGPGSQSPK
jgi:hypothetical protein